jgi:hypothetical protein
VRAPPFPGASSRRFVWRSGSEFSPSNLLERSLFEFGFGEELLEQGVLVPRSLKSLASSAFMPPYCLRQL